MRTEPLVVVADDDDDLRELMVDALARDGNHVTELEDGFELYDYVEFVRRLHHPAGLPAVIVTDVRMPGNGGLEIIGHARRQGLTCPVIVITAFPEPSLLQQSLELGNTTLLRKPLDLVQLRDAVRTLAAPARQP